MKLIDKDAVVAEIEKWRDEIKKAIFSIPLTGSDKSYATFEYEILGRIKDFLDTLEVKEVKEPADDKAMQRKLEWLDKKKELKKIEQPKLTEFEEAVKDMMDDYRDATDDNDATVEEVKEHAAYLLSLIPCKPTAWSEEDECYISECMGAIATKDGWSFEDKRKTKHWLNSLKQRMGG